MVTSSSRRSVLSVYHDRLAVFLAAFVPLSAVPLASNRASWWLLWSAVFGIVCAIYIWRFYSVEPKGRLRFENFLGVSCLLAIFPVWGVVQALPVAQLIPSTWLALPNGLDSRDLSTVSVQPYVAASAVIRFTGYIMLAALVLEVARRTERVMLMGKVVFFGVVLQAIYALVALKVLGDFSPWGPKEQYAGSATGTFVNRNSLATFLGFGMILGLGLLVEQNSSPGIRETRKPGAFGRIGTLSTSVVIGQVFLLITLLLTQSRLGLAASLSGFVVSLLVWRWIASRSIGLVLRDGVLSVLAFGLVFTAFSISEGVATRLLFSADDGENRLDIYRQVLEMLETRPITGFGLDSFGAAFEMFRTSELRGAAHYDLAHNTYLALWSEAGLLVGSVPPLAIICALIVLVRRLSQADGFAGFAIAGIGVTVTAALHSLGDFSLEIPANVYLFVTIICLGLGYRSKRANPKVEQEISKYRPYVQRDPVELVPSKQKIKL